MSSFLVSIREVSSQSHMIGGGLGSRSKDSHILKHQETVHGGAKEPNFVMRVVNHSRKPLFRQIA